VVGLVLQDDKIQVELHQRRRRRRRRCQYKCRARSSYRRRVEREFFNRDFALDRCTAAKPAVFAGRTDRAV
jgi:hypothetical protein